MSGDFITLKLDDLAVQRRFDALVRRVGNPKPAFEEIGDMFISDIKLNFIREQDPQGKPWVKSARAEAEGGQTLSDSAYLRNSFSKDVSDRGVAVGTAVIYAGIHQFGGDILPKNKPYLIFQVGGEWVCVKKVTMPKREFMGFNERNKSATLRILTDYLEASV